MRFNVPQFKGYEGAIQANQSMMNAFKNVGDQSQDYLKMEEQKKNNAWNQSFETDKFAEARRQNEISNNNTKRTFDNTDRAFNYGVDQDKQSYAFKNKEFDYRAGQDTQNNNYRDKVFNHSVNQDGIRNNQWTQSHNNTVANQNKPSYQMLETADEQGNPTYTRYNPKTGESFATALTPYVKPKEMSPYQEDSIMLRKEMQEEKLRAAAEKKLVGSLEFSKLKEDDQIRAIQMLNETGKAPNIVNDTSFLGKGYHIGSSKEDLAKKQKQLEADKKALGL